MVRPQATVAVKNHENTSGKGIKDILIHTGQHYDYTMSKIFFDELGIKEPDYHLGIGSGSHGEQTGLALQRVENVLLKEKPDMVIVYGDTNSTLSGALAASKLHIPLAHVEAGLRSYNKYMPEEINRVLTDHMSSVLLCPTEVAVKNLQKEDFTNIINDGSLYKVSNQRHNIVLNNASDPSVINIGDVMYDVVQYAIGIAMTRSKIMEQLQINPNDYCLLTLHRAENIDNRESLEGIIAFVNNASAGKTVIFPMHPRAKEAFGSSHKKFSKNVTIIDPVGYFDMLILLKNCELAFTDSGGLQKEAYWLKAPCITLRNETEWVETIQSGWNILYKEYNGQHSISNNNDKYYGDGKAAERIINVICKE